MCTEIEIDGKIRCTIANDSNDRHGPQEYFCYSGVHEIMCIVEGCTVRLVARGDGDVMRLPAPQGMGAK